MTFEAIAQRYIDVYHDCTKEQIMDLLNDHPGRVISNEHMVIIFVRIDEFTLATIDANPLVVSDNDFIMDCFKQQGNHIYLLKGFGSARGYRDLIKKLISWWHPESISYHIDKDHFSHAHVVYSEERKNLKCHS